MSESESPKGVTAFLDPKDANNLRRLIEFLQLIEEALGPHALPVPARVYADLERIATFIELATIYDPAGGAKTMWLDGEEDPSGKLSRDQLAKLEAKARES